jgi:alpha-glucosidase
VGGDVPGFAGVADPELAARWFSYAALTPFCRCHHQLGTGDHYPWSFGPEVERIARSALELRYRLLPYLYTAFRISVETGSPVQRPLVFDFQDDPRTPAIDDEFMLGDALLVAPVLDPGETSRSTYLPAGSFVDWHSRRSVTGGADVVSAAPLERCPMYVRGGAVIPMLAEAPPSTMSLAPELIELHAFVPDDDVSRTSVLYEDDGLTFAFAGGSCFVTSIELERKGDELRIDATVTGAGFPEFRRRRFRIVFANAVPREVVVNGTPHPIVGDAVTFDNTGQPFHVTAKL